MLLPNYQKTYKNYCISYLGDNFIYPIILSNLRLKIEKAYKELNIYYCYNRTVYEKFKKKKNVIERNFLENNEKNFGFIYEIKEDFIVSPIEELIDFEKIRINIKSKKTDSNKCLLIKSTPFKKLNDQDVVKINNFVSKKGYFLTEKVEKIEEIGAIAGVESPELFSAAFYGLPTFLFNKNCLNLNVYKKLFLNQEILNS